MCRFTDYQLRIFEKAQIECRDIARLMVDFQDNELPLALRERLEEHLKSCPACAEFEETYRMTIELARELKEPPMPAGAKRRLRQALNKRLGTSLSLED